MDVTAQRDSRDDGMPPDCARIEVRVGEIRQLFNSMDPAPFRERDLDPKAEEFIVDSARELRRRAPLGLVVRLSRPAVRPRTSPRSRRQSGNTSPSARSQRARSSGGCCASAAGAS